MDRYEWLSLSQHLEATLAADSVLKVQELSDRLSEQELESLLSFMKIMISLLRSPICYPRNQKGQEVSI